MTTALSAVDLILLAGFVLAATVAAVDRSKR